MVEPLYVALVMDQKYGLMGVSDHDLCVHICGWRGKWKSDTVSNLGFGQWGYGYVLVLGYLNILF